MEFPSQKLNPLFKVGEMVKSGQLSPDALSERQVQVGFEKKYKFDTKDDSVKFQGDVLIARKDGAREVLKVDYNPRLVDVPVKILAAIRIGGQDGKPGTCYWIVQGEGLGDGDRQHVIQADMIQGERGMIFQNHKQIFDSKPPLYSIGPDSQMAKVLPYDKYTVVADYERFERVLELISERKG